MATRNSFSRFDLTVFALLAACGFLLAFWGIQSRRQPPAGSLQFLFLRLDQEGRNQLHLSTLTATATVDQTRQLSQNGQDVWDFAPTSDGRQVLFSVLDPFGTSDLWHVSPSSSPASRLLACADAACSNARYAPDGRLLAFARRAGAGFAAPFFSPPRIWLMDSTSAETLPLFADSQQLAFEPRWSPDGRWLSYIDPQAGGLGLIHLEEGRTALYANALGEAGEWHPTEARLLTTNSWLQGEEHVTHLLGITAKSGQVIDLSGEEALVNDSGGSYSPDGRWIAFRRKLLTGPEATRGKQIWLMRADGSDARSLTSDADSDYGNPDWSPDSRYLLTRRLPLTGGSVTLSIWLIDIERGHLGLLMEPGDQPLWLP